MFINFPEQNNKDHQFSNRQRTTAGQACSFRCRTSTSVTHVHLGMAVADRDVVLTLERVVALVAAAEHEALGLVVGVRVVRLVANVLQLRLQVIQEVVRRLRGHGLRVLTILVDGRDRRVVRAVLDLRDGQQQQQQQQQHNKPATRV